MPGKTNKVLPGEPPQLPFSNGGRRLHDYSTKRSRRASLVATHAVKTLNRRHGFLCASLTDWNIDVLRRRHQTNDFVVSHEEHVDVTFQIRKQRMEQYLSKMQQQAENDKDKKKCTSSSSSSKNSKKPSKRQDLAIVLNQETGLPQAIPEAAPNRSRTQRRASMGAGGMMESTISTTYGAACCSPVQLRRYASLTELEDKLKQLPGQSPTRQKHNKVGICSYTNLLTQQLEVSILNADMPHDKKKRIMRRSSIGNGSLHSSSMDSSAHSTTYGADDDEDNPYGYGDDARPRSLEMDASQALHRMRRTSIGGVMPNLESGVYGYGDAAPNIRALNPKHAQSSTHDNETTCFRRRMRRSSVGGVMSTFEAEPYGYGDTMAYSGGEPSQPFLASPNFHAAHAMRSMRRSSIGGITPSSATGLTTHAYGDCPPNVRWISQSTDALLPGSSRAGIPKSPMTDVSAMNHISKGHQLYSSPVQTNSFSSSQLLEGETKNKHRKKRSSGDPAESLRGLEQLALDLSGQPSPLSPKRASPRGNAPGLRALTEKPEFLDGPTKRSPTKMLPAKRVALGA